MNNLLEEAPAIIRNAIKNGWLSSAHTTVLYGISMGWITPPRPALPVPDCLKESGPRIVTPIDPELVLATLFRIAGFSNHAIIGDSRGTCIDATRTAAVMLLRALSSLTFTDTAIRLQRDRSNAYHLYHSGVCRMKTDRYLNNLLTKTVAALSSPVPQPSTLNPQPLRVPQPSTLNHCD